MKKVLQLAFVGMLLLPTLAHASVDMNLKYGMKNSEVSELQDFLSDKGFLASASTGFFGFLTLKAVQAYQTSLTLPSTGYVGILTRAAINAELATVTAASTAAEIAETGTSTPVVNHSNGISGSQTGGSNSQQNNNQSNSQFNNKQTQNMPETHLATLGDLEKTVKDPATGLGDYRVKFIGDQEFRSTTTARTYAYVHILGPNNTEWKSIMADDDYFRFDLPRDAGNWTWTVTSYSQPFSDYPNNLTPIGQTSGSFSI